MSRIATCSFFLLAAVTLVLSSPPPARLFPENAIAPLEEDDSAARLPIEETGYNQRFRRATVDSRHHATGGVHGGYIVVGGAHGSYYPGYNHHHSYPHYDPHYHHHHHHGR